MDIRLVRGHSHPLWAWTAGLVGLAVLAWGAALLFGDATVNSGRAVGANANFGADRGAVVPVRPALFEAAFPLEDRELGRLLRVRGTADSEQRSGALWVRTTAGRWILMRLEPAGSTRFYRGSPVDVVGYLEKISRAEFDAWMDTLGVYLPRPRPGVKFGDLPDSGFIRVDTLFIRDYYISVRPEGARRGAAQALAPPETPDPEPAETARAAPPPRPAPRPTRREPEPEPRDVRPSIPAPEPVRPDAPRDTLRLGP